MYPLYSIASIAAADLVSATTERQRRNTVKTRINLVLNIDKNLLQRYFMRMKPVPLWDSKMLNDGEETIQSHSTDDSKGNSTVTGSSCVKGNTDEEKPGGSERSRSDGAPDRRGDSMTTGASLSVSPQARVIV